MWDIERVSDEQRTLIDPFLDAMDVTAIFADGGHFKSTWGHYLGLHVAYGRDVMGRHKVRQGRVVYLDFEGTPMRGASDFAHRTDRLVRGLGWEDIAQLDADLGHPLEYRNCKGYSLDDLLAYLRREAATEQIALYIFDSVSWMVAGNLADDAVARDACNKVGTIPTGSILIAHQAKKGKEEREHEGAHPSASAFGSVF